MWPFKKTISVPRIETASLKPGDVVVIQTNDPPDAVTAQSLVELLSKQAGFKLGVMFLPYDAKLSVLSRVAIDDGKPAPTPVPSDDEDPKTP